MSDDEPQKRRESTRVDATFQVSYATVDELVVAYTQDLSRGGMFLRTNRFLPINAVVRLQLALPGDGGEIPVIGRVVYLRDEAQAARTGKPAGMGLQFLDMRGETARGIERFIAEHTVTEAARPAVLHRLNVVVADDIEAFRDQVAQAFKKRGDRVRVAADGLEALTACLNEAPDVLISDVQMPRMDGWQLLRIIRARPALASIPVVFLTSLSGEEERLRGYQLGVDDYVAKPFRAEELVARVERLVARAAKSTRAYVAQKTLRGDLGLVSLASVLAFLEMERHTGVLLVVEARSASIYIREGRPLRVEVSGAPDGHNPRELMYEVLEWPRGQFEFAPQDVYCDDEVQMSVTGLLLESARRGDEAGR